MMYSIGYRKLFPSTVHGYCVGNGERNLTLWASWILVDTSGAIKYIIGIAHVNIENHIVGLSNRSSGESSIARRSGFSISLWNVTCNSWWSSTCLSWYIQKINTLRKAYQIFIYDSAILLHSEITSLQWQATFSSIVMKLTPIPVPFIARSRFVMWLHTKLAMAKVVDMDVRRWTVRINREIFDDTRLGHRPMKSIIRLMSRA